MKYTIFVFLFALLLHIIGCGLHNDCSEAKNAADCQTKENFVDAKECRWISGSGDYGYGYGYGYGDSKGRCVPK